MSFQALLCHAKRVFFTLLFAFFLIMLVYQVFVTNLLWADIAGKSSRLLSYELQFIVVTLTALFLLLLTYRPPFHRTITLLLTIPWLAVTIASWLYFDFYSDFIIPDTFLLFNELINGPGGAAFTALPSFDISVQFALYMGIVIILMLSLQSWSRFKLHKITATLLALFFIYYAVDRERWFVESAGDLSMVAPPGQVHPTTHFLRHLLFDLSKVDVTPEHFEALSALDDRVIKKGNPDSLKQDFNPLPIKNNTENIILVVLESVRAAETGYFGKNQGITPNLDKIAAESIALNNFYSSSNQTVRAEVSLLCGVLDFSTGAPFSVRAMDLNIRCLPKILADKGFETMWFHGNEATFFDRASFFKDIGFQHLYDETVINEEVPGLEKLGWGIPDKDLFTFAAKKLEQTKEPFFAEILTVTNHYPFDYGLPETGAELAENSDVYNDYLKAIHYTDAALGEFWHWFENSRFKDNTAVFIVTDHGLLVMSAQQKKQSVYYKHEMQFKVPFVAYIPGFVGEVDKDQVASQVDFPATVLDLLGISEKGAYFMGGGIFDTHKQNFSISTGFWKLCGQAG